MADLIEKFFRSELTEAEDKALSKLLASSVEEAERFEKKAEKAYFSYGLPEPKAPGHLLRFLRSHWGSGLVIGAVVGGAVLWHEWPKTEMLTENPTVAPIPVVATAAQTAPVLVKKMLKEIGKPPINNRVESVPVSLGQAPPEPGFETDYRNLKVEVDQEKTGPILVRILGPDGSEVRKLYDGPLAAGKWSFTWDGLLDKNKTALPGVYHIEVKGETASMSKEVEIK